MCSLIFCNASKKIVLNEPVSPLQHKDYSNTHVLLLFLLNTEHGWQRKTTSDL